MSTSDAELLELWLLSRDGEAFNELMTRHAAMVFGTCRRIIGNTVEAEDLTQECFWKLAKTKTNPGVAIPSWLHTVATRQALDYIRAAKRRSAREHRFMAERPDHEEARWEDIQPLVDEAIEELPETLRHPLVAHFLEGKTHLEIAAGLGLSRQTVTYRIRKALYAVRHHLDKQSLAIGITALTALISSNIAEAAPVTLAARLGKIAIAGTNGGSTASAIALSGRTGTMSGVKLLGGVVMTKKIGMGVVLGVALIFALLMGLDQEEAQIEQEEPIVHELAQLEPEPLAPVQVEPEPTSQPVVDTSAPTPPEEVIPEGMFRVRGKVVNTTGQPVSGAKLSLYHDTKSWGLGDQVVDTTRSDQNGEFFFPALVEFDKIVSHDYAQDTFIIMAKHKAYAMAWRHVKPAADHSQYKLTMTSPTTRTLTVVDKDKKPMEGALVWPYIMGTPSSANPDFREQIKAYAPTPMMSQLTDAQGVARFDNLPDTRTSVYATKSGYAKGLAFSGNTITLTRGASLSGRVATTRGRPVSGALVVLGATFMNHYEWSRTDEEGQYAFVDIAAEGWDMSAWGNQSVGTGAYKVTLRSDEYSVESFSVELHAGDEIEGYDIVAFPGTLIRCQVVTSDTGEPLAGARVSGSSESGRLNGYTDKDGIVEFCVLGGLMSLFIVSGPEGIYLLLSPGERLAQSTEIEFMAEGSEMEVTLVSPPIGGGLVTVSGSVSWSGDTKPDGLVLVASSESGIAVSGQSGGYGAETDVDSAGRFEFEGVPEGSILQLHSMSGDHQFGAVGAFPVEKDGAPFELVLEPTVSMDFNIVGDDGNPIANTKARVSPVLNDVCMWRASHRLPVDANGWITVDGVLQGVEYRIETGIHIDPDSNPPQHSELVVLAP